MVQWCNGAMVQLCNCARCKLIKVQLWRPASAQLLQGGGHWRRTVPLTLPFQKCMLLERVHIGLQLRDADARTVSLVDLPRFFVFSPLFLNTPSNTNLYCAPSGKKADAYAFGILLWGMYTRDRPYRGWKSSTFKLVVVCGLVG
jgi:hypothetical protein